MTALVFFYPFSFGASASREIMAVSVTGNRYGHRWLLLCNTNVFLSAGHNGLIQRCCRRDVRRQYGWIENNLAIKFMALSRYFTTQSVN